MVVMRRRSGLVNIKNDFYRAGSHNKRHQQMRTCKRVDELTDLLDYRKQHDDRLAEDYDSDEILCEIYSQMMEVMETPTVEEYNNGS